MGGAPQYGGDMLKFDSPVGVVDGREGTAIKNDSNNDIVKHYVRC